METFFKIIIPNYNSANYIEKCIESIECQTFKDFVIIVIDDLSTDNSMDIIYSLQRKYNNIYIHMPKEKVWNGGARNYGIDYPIESKYTLFMDDDDWYSDNNCLETIYNLIINNNYPDCIRLSYNLVLENEIIPVVLKDDNPIDLTNSLFIAPWTHCIKSDIVVKFPENTLVEDVSWNIEQCDKIQTVVPCLKPINCWNRTNQNSISVQEEVNNSFCGKRKSSVFRCIADLLDLELEHDYTRANRDWRVEQYLESIKNGTIRTF